VILVLTQFGMLYIFYCTKQCWQELWLPECTATNKHGGGFDHVGRSAFFV